jgi:hypothetical protein
MHVIEQPLPLASAQVHRRRSLAMSTNMGTIDRLARIIVGLALIAAALGLFGPAYQSVWGWIGAIPLLTAIIGWCPVYSIFGIRTCKQARTS